MAEPRGVPRSIPVKRAETWPPFFDGRLRMQIVMATATFGPMRLMEIARLNGESARANSRWNQAARYLETIGVLIREHKHPTFVTVGLDRRHPAFNEIQRFGKALYRLYLEPLGYATPEKRRRPLKPARPLHNPAALDLYVLGDRKRSQFLHLLAEIGSCPAHVLVRSAGASHRTYDAIRMWEAHGTVRTALQRAFGRQTYLVRLNREWPAHNALLRLIKKLNAWMPDYADMGEAYRIERDLGHYTREWRYNRRRR